MIGQEIEKFEAFRVPAKTLNSFPFAELEDLQIGVLKLLCTCNDAASYNETSRALFLAKFRQFIKDQLIVSRVSSFPSFIKICTRCNSTATRKQK